MGFLRVSGNQYIFHLNLNIVEHFPIFRLPSLMGELIRMQFDELTGCVSANANIKLRDSFQKLSEFDNNLD